MESQYTPRNSKPLNPEPLNPELPTTISHPPTPHPTPLSHRTKQHSATTVVYNPSH